MRGKPDTDVPAPASAQGDGTAVLRHLHVEAQALLRGTPEQDILNPLGIDAIRYFAGSGVLVWGARTIASDPEWRYIAVRRAAYCPLSSGAGLSPSHCEERTTISIASRISSTTAPSCDVFLVPILGPIRLHRIFR